MEEESDDEGEHVDSRYWGRASRKRAESTGDGVEREQVDSKESTTDVGVKRETKREQDVERRPTPRRRLTGRSSCPARPGG